jgi:hypothetical protein
MVDGYDAQSLVNNVVPFPQYRTTAPRETTGEEVRPVDGLPTARGPARRDPSPQASLQAVVAARTAAEVAATQFLHGLGPNARGSLPTIHR